MNQKFRVIFADFLNALRGFWLEVMGGVFLMFGIVFTLAAFRDYRAYVSNPDHGVTRFAVEAFFSGLMLLYSLDSFWKARKPR